MKTTLRHGKSAFTLIEILVVITIIAVLAAATVGGTRFAKERQKRNQAEIQIQLLAKSLEEYKLDRGIYPATTDSVDGRNNSDILFNALYWDSDDDDEGAGIGDAAGDQDQKIYLDSLDPATSSHKWTQAPASDRTKITDPWKNEYRYRSAKDSTGTQNASTDNVDFDLWSSGPDGESKPSITGDQSNKDDIKL
ncbi:MAG: prepilin-type N-terminal cleavage/methylation domain-containing protein [Akkermansiaceae bacterium]|nr:prepilin-type N-terminal cleavage/methylation domain-containing protein [Akkermansiaceae bacterium]